MTEIILIIVGVIFMIGSFFVTEKLSQREITQISELSSEEMKRILEKNMEQAKRRVEDLIESIVERTEEPMERALQKETNLKIQSISEYAGGVLEEVQKNHEEVMFLYSMLNDKHTELVQTAGRLEELKLELLKLERDVSGTVMDSEERLKQLSEEITEQIYNPVQMEEVWEEELPEVEEEEEKELLNSNQCILELYQQGVGITDIARQLKLGVGEVKLVIDLYREEEA